MSPGGILYWCRGESVSYVWDNVWDWLNKRWSQKSDPALLGYGNYGFADSPAKGALAVGSTLGLNVGLGASLAGPLSVNTALAAAYHVGMTGGFLANTYLAHGYAQDYLSEMDLLNRANYDRWSQFNVALEMLKHADYMEQIGAQQGDSGSLPNNWGSEQWYFARYGWANRFGYPSSSGYGSALLGQ